MRSRLILCACLLAFSVPASAAGAAALPEFHSAGFGLQGTNGYDVGFSAFSERPDGRGNAYVLVHGVDRKGGFAAYRAPAIVTDAYVKADFGPFGKVDLAVRPSGRVRMVHVKCSDQSFPFEPTAYEGIFEFRGEGGFTQARATQARLPAATSFCSTGGGYGESRGGWRAGGAPERNLLRPRTQGRIPLHQEPPPRPGEIRR